MRTWGRRLHQLGVMLLSAVIVLSGLTGALVGKAEPAPQVDVTTLVSIARSKPVHNRKTRTFDYTITVTNISPAPLSAPL